MHPNRPSPPNTNVVAPRWCLSARRLLDLIRGVCERGGESSRVFRQRLVKAAGTVLRNSVRFRQPCPCALLAIV